jgi:hypothetical protein
MSIFKRFAGESPEPLEVRNWILRDLENEITPAGRGEKVFPFNSITALLYAPDDKRRGLYEEVLINDQTLERAIRKHLSLPRCSPPRDLHIEVSIVGQPAPAWAEKHYDIKCTRSRRDQKTTAHLVTVTGKAERKRYKITKTRTNIGRTVDVIDPRGLPVRRNDFVFVDGEKGVNETVSRLQAHIDFNSRTGEYYLYDDTSQIEPDEASTQILSADGRRTVVSGRIGARLRTGDQLYFGQASVRFEERSEAAQEITPSDED